MGIQVIQEERSSSSSRAPDRIRMNGMQTGYGKVSLPHVLERELQRLRYLKIVANATVAK